MEGGMFHSVQQVLVIGVQSWTSSLTSQSPWTFWSFLYAGSLQYRLELPKTLIIFPQTSSLSLCNILKAGTLTFGTVQTLLCLLSSWNIWLLVSRLSSLSLFPMFHSRSPKTNSAEARLKSLSQEICSSKSSKEATRPTKTWMIRCSVIRQNSWKLRRLKIWACWTKTWTQLKLKRKGRKPRKNSKVNFNN